MAKAAGQRLKVFVAQIGFYDTVVATTSQAAALKAWGTRQNLFAGGQARQIDDPQAVEAATANPEVPLRRLIGTDNPFELKPRGLPVVPDAPKKWGRRGPYKAARTTTAEEGEAAGQPLGTR